MLGGGLIYGAGLILLRVIALADIRAALVGLRGLLR
jgi:hypothetical protein